MAQLFSSYESCHVGSGMLARYGAGVRKWAIRSLRGQTTGKKSSSVQGTVKFPSNEPGPGKRSRQKKFVADGRLFSRFDRWKGR